FCCEGLEIVVRQKLEGDSIRPDHRGCLLVAELLVLPAPDRFVKAGRGGEISHRQVQEDHLGHLTSPSRLVSDFGLRGADGGNTPPARQRRCGSAAGTRPTTPQQRTACLSAA